MQCGAHSSLRLTLGSAAVSHGPRPSQAQSQSQSQTQSAITNRILLVARRKRLTTRKCLTVCVYNGHNVLHTQREREKESGRVGERKSGRAAVQESECAHGRVVPSQWAHDVLHYIEGLIYSRSIQTYYVLWHLYKSQIVFNSVRILLINLRQIAVLSHCAPPLVLLLPPSSALH